jgi:hypothetical protein
MRTFTSATSRSITNSKAISTCKPVTQGSELHLTGNSHLPRGSLLVSGNIQLRDDYPADLSFRMDQLDLDPLWHAYARRPTHRTLLVDGSRSPRSAPLSPLAGPSTAI